MTIIAGHTARVGGDETYTPDDPILDRVRLVDVIALDPATPAHNPTGARIFVTKDSQPEGLGADWLELSGGGLTFLNPPYSRSLGSRFISKACAEARRGCEIIALLRCDSSTEGVREVFRTARLVCFPKRIKFVGAVGSPNFASLVAYFGPRPQTFARAFRDLGPLLAPPSEFTSPRVQPRPEGEQPTSGKE
jgi:hypothetical protein